MTVRLPAIVLAMICFISGSASAETNLKPIDPAALRKVIEATAKELMLPGAMVLSARHNCESSRCPPLDAYQNANSPRHAADFAGR